jgi:hypothetical protein
LSYIDGTNKHPTNREVFQMPTTPRLSQGSEISYKAFHRKFVNQASSGVLYLLATSWYNMPGFTLFFEQDGEEYSLMELAPSGPVDEIVTYYIANWTSSRPVATVPSYVKIVDAQGEHTVQVGPW